MGLRQLGPQWIRRLARVTGLDIAYASGNGTYRFFFTTSDHRHGWFDLKVYRGLTEGPTWSLIDGCPNLASCAELSQRDQ